MDIRIWEEYCLHPARPPATHGWIPIVQTAMHLMSLNGCYTTPHTALKGRALDDAFVKVNPELLA